MTDPDKGSVLFIEHSKLLTGGQVSCLNMARLAVDDGRRVSLLYPMGGSMETAARGRLGDEVSHHAGPDVELTDRRKTLIDVLKLLWLTLSALRFLPLLMRHDVIYVSSARWFMQAFFLSQFVRRRFVYHVRVDNSALEKRLIRWIARSPRTHAVVTNTEFVHGKLLEAHPDLGSAPRLLMFRTPIFPPFNTLPFEDRFSGHDRSTPYVVAIVGRLTPTKGQDILLRIAEPLQDRFRFVVIGAASGEFADYAAKLQQEAPANVSFYGESRDVAATLSEVRAQFSLVPSRWDDPFPLVASESLCSSCFTIVRRRGGLTDLATTIGLPSFGEDDAEVLPVFERLAESPPEFLAAETRRMHAEVQSRFSFEIFHRSFNALCFDSVDGAPALAV